MTSGKIAFAGIAFALAALLMAAFPAALAAEGELSETDILAAFEGKKITALVKRRENISSTMMGLAGMHRFYLYPDRRLRVDRSASFHGGATSESGKWWTVKKKGGRLCMQRERENKRCYKITRSGDDYEFYDKKGLAFTTDSVDPL